MTTLVHLSDIHFGRDADLEQVGVLESLVPSLGADAVVISGDQTQRSRHGELQRALVLADRMRATAPTVIVPGNHDVEWWKSPFGVFGGAVKYAKYRRYFGENLSPGLELPGLVIASALTSHGVAFGSMTWKFWRDPAVKGHLPQAEIERAARKFADAPPGALKVLVLHHNVLRGAISSRMGLARWRQAQRRIETSGAELVLCGHDHQESVGTLGGGGGVVVAAAGTHCFRSRGHRPSSFNLIESTAAEIRVCHQIWDKAERRFVPGVVARFQRNGR